MLLQNKTGFSLINVALSVAIGFGSVTAGAANNEFQYLAGKTVNNSHNAFEAQGYKKLHNETVNNQNQVVWWNADQKDCVVSNENYGKVTTIYDVSKSDCEPYISSGTSTAVGLVAGVAAIAGIAALINHNKHKQQDRDNEARNNEEYDQGFNDGRNNYHRYGSNSESYNNGFEAGREDRHSSHNSYSNYGGNDRSYNNYSSLGKCICDLYSFS